MENKIIYKEESYIIKKATIEVKKHLPDGLLEKDYQKDLSIELNNQGLNIETEKELDVYYKGNLVGQYFADIVIDNKIIIELKSCDVLNDFHLAQLLNYLKITNYKLGILINFRKNGKGFEFKRIAS